MPIYEYRRPDGTTFEVQQSFTDEPLARDPDSGVPVTRVLHAPAVHFKGAGFYNTDYGTRKRERERERELAAAANGDGKAGDGKAGDGKGGDGKGAEGDSPAGASSASDAAGKDGASPSPSGDGAKAKPAARDAGKASARDKRVKPRVDD